MVSEAKLSNPAFRSKIADFLNFRNYSVFFNSNNASRGVAIVIKSTIFSRAVVTFECPNENALLLELTSGPLNLNWQLCVVYLDSSDDVNYLSNLTRTFNPNLPLIFGGDFNSVLDPEKDPKLNMDLFNRENIPNIRCSEFLATNIGNLGLLDPFRLLKGEFSNFTFQSGSGASRLDHILIPTFLRS